MARCVLMNLDDPWFVFEHAMSHRNGLGIMSPLDRFSAIPYFVDPMEPINPAQNWSLNHQQAHNDAMNHLPSYFGSTKLGLDIGQNLMEWDLTDPEQASVWAFENHMEHYVGGNTITPNIPQPPPAPQWTWPFW